MKMVKEKRNRNERRDVQKFISNSLLIGLYKAKKNKVKDIFDFGRNYANVLALLPTLQTSLVAF